MRLILPALVILLASCQHYSEEKVFGVFVERNYKTRNLLRWEGGNSSGRYDEICNRATGECFRHAFSDGPSWVQGKIYAPYFSESKTMVAIYANNSSYKTVSGFDLRIFDATSGIEWRCDNCEGMRFGAPASGKWNGDGEFLSSTNENTAGDKLKSIWLVEVIGDRYRIRLLKIIKVMIDASFHGAPQLSPNGDLLAWIVCEPVCVLVELTVASGDEKRQSAECPNDGYSKILWVEGSAKPKC